MEEYFNLIEEKIKAAGYQGNVVGEEIYDEICDQIEDKEEGSYLFLIHKGNDICFEYKIDILETEFNLSYIRIQTQTQVFQVDFD